MDFYLYTEKNQRELPVITANPNINAPNLYIPSKGLTNAVNVALALGQPLLLTGEPGTGKTRLAHHVAWIFKLDKVLRFNAQTTSTAKDLFYRYDALGHFQYTQTNKKELTPDEVEEKFIHYAGLGEAIRSNKRSVVLIDEIDKAPRDLPNDVLASLEDLTFSVPEINKTYSSDPSNKPVIIMTSNSEKNLPDAFLRRVTYFHIDFPDAKTLLRILETKVQTKGDDGHQLNLDTLVDHFEMIRKGKRVKLKKNPATAELIFWALLIKKLKLDTSKLSDPSSMSAEEKEQLSLSYSVLAKNKEDLATLNKIL